MSAAFAFPFAFHEQGQVEVLVRYSERQGGNVSAVFSRTARQRMRPLKRLAMSRHEELDIVNGSHRR